MNVIKLTRILNGRDKTLDWLIEKRLLPAQMRCKYCNKIMNYQRYHGWGRFRCRNINHHKNKVNVHVSASKGTWFEDCKLKAEDVVLLMYGFAHNWSYEQVRHEATFGMTKLSGVSVSDWFHHCREVCMCALDHRYQSEQLVGGPDRIVHLVEAKADNFYCNKSRFDEGSLIFAVIDEISGYRLDTSVDGKCDALTIQSIINKHVAPGSEVRIDSSKTYKHLTGIDANVNNPIPHEKKRRENNSWKQMCEFLWRREISERNLDPFEALIEAIIYVYPVSEAMSTKLDADDSA